MATRKSSFLDKVLGRIDRLDADGVQSVMRRLARERSFFETLFHTIEDGVLVIDAKHKIIWANQSATHLLGLPPDSDDNPPLSRYLPGLNLGTSGGRDAVSRHELEIQFPRPRFLHIYAAPIKTEEGQPAGTAFVLRDATESRKQTNAAIENERVQALTLLSASVAHEIGNPLNALHIHLQLIERELAKFREPATPARAKWTKTTGSPPALAKIDSYLQVAKGEITRLDYIVSQFLNAIRPTRPNRKPHSLNESVEQTLKLLKPEIENRDIAIRTDLAPQLPSAKFDAAQIQQVLVNLVKNAIQAMTAGGMLTLSTGSSAQGIWAAVNDTGGGIPADRINRIFEPFYTTKQQGSGLGLMIVQRIVREHGGHIEILSDAGRGTTFRVWLPPLRRQPLLLKS
ncbi:MAG: PAS domain-containing protein [Pedosphaera sp.]|nr:PAS domain-containing protein [Pedosphaera sp.]